jgi:hypothetical protein
LLDGEETKVSLLVKRQPEEVMVGTQGSESDCSRQSGFGSDEGDEAFGMVEIGFCCCRGSCTSTVRSWWRTTAVTTHPQ